jgi:3-oxoacyl-[acyl-carrier-protein] synthase-3
MGISIRGLGVYSPAQTVTNTDFERIFDTSDEWIRTRTGIGERQYSAGVPTWVMGAKAAASALADAGMSGADVDLIITSTITADFFTPSVSCLVADAIGARCTAFDIGAACAGFVYALDCAERFLRTDSTIKNVLVISSEMLSRYVDFEDRSSAILFGDGAAAAVIKRTEASTPECDGQKPEQRTEDRSRRTEENTEQTAEASTQMSGEQKPEAGTQRCDSQRTDCSADGDIYGSFLGADGSGGKYLYGKLPAQKNPFAEYDLQGMEDFPGKERVILQNGREVYKFAVKILPEAAEKAATAAGITLSDITWFIPHQANIRIIEAAAERMNIPLDRFIINIKNHGNTSSASIPLAFAEAVNSGQIKRGDTLCLVGFGAGLTYGAIVLKY